MAERSGYEIRENLLHLAHEIVRQNAMMTLEATRSKVDGKPIVDWKVLGRGRDCDGREAQHLRHDEVGQRGLQPPGRISLAGGATLSFGHGFFVENPTCSPFSMFSRSVSM